VVFWFVGFALVVTWLVFHDPAFDYRLVAVGAVLPNVLLIVPVVVLAVVMLATRDHRHARRRWLALPIGMFLHLVAAGAWTDVAAGAWTDADTFWWPFGAFGVGLPWTDRSWAVLFLEELAGLAAIVWFVRRFGLAEPAVRESFFRTGRVPR